MDYPLSVAVVYCQLSVSVMTQLMTHDSVLFKMKRPSKFAGPSENLHVARLFETAERLRLVIIDVKDR